MCVLLIRAGAHASEPPRTVLVLESDVANYLANGWVRIGTDPGPSHDEPKWAPLERRRHRVAHPTPAAAREHGGVMELRPEIAIEVQEFWLRGFNKKADFRDSGQPERRRPRRVLIPWPPNRRWPVNDPECRLARQLATRD